MAAAAPAAEEQKAPELEYKEYTNPGATIYDIFGVYGVENKSEIEANPGCSIDLWYDFTPFNSKDPVLLSLMTAKKYWKLQTLLRTYIFLSCILGNIRSEVLLTYNPNGLPVISLTLNF